ncbi:MAG: hypothetical protein A2391_03185 [Candidatus Brennerbacteria bacterium RIFOXYB1_FULL_41_13]|uniref:Uncharacterized protein n=1 Tax=Candidatus Brennerbacteria bacterium RIFOXYD1_FULL_41_16 TaxID=1797529 RepID=A0A1G1XIZ6_9BACT|nr:MAG: hypothetical protein A2391_03185 [Candidatus Brennerbacteria bacterium RIFOXYB1_FULL_41_13]OGY40063.1 MAG: hypothetical protein A2570_01510 [Candidatus Brennerbacteria bacterium RIFOXYD1_FULL_41_16]
MVFIDLASERLSWSGVVELPGARDRRVFLDILFGDQSFAEKNFDGYSLSANITNTQICLHCSSKKIVWDIELEEYNPEIMFFQPWQ